MDQLDILCCLCKNCCDRPFKRNFTPQLQYRHLSPEQLAYINDRYLPVVEKTESDYRRTSVAFMILTNMITIFTIVVAALISLNQVVVGNFRDPIFWITWSLTVLTAIANKILYAYSIDKKYIVNFALQEKLKAEGWKFTQGVDIYEGIGQDVAFKLFVSQIEEFRTKSAESNALLNFNDTVEIVPREAQNNGPVMQSRNIGALRSLSSLGEAPSPREGILRSASFSDSSEV